MRKYPPFCAAPPERGVISGGAQIMSFGAPISQRHGDLAVSDGLGVGDTRSRLHIRSGALNVGSMSGV
jgi:hypothetical protein